MHYYATLADAKAELKATGTVDDSKILRNLRNISARVDRLKQSRRPFFLPYVESRLVRVDRDHINSYDSLLTFPDPLLSLASVDVAGTALTVGTTVEAWPTLDSPFHQLRIIGFDSVWYSYYTDDGEPPMATITGVWGFHRDYANAWLSVDTVKNAAGITAAATSITVADVDGTDGYGFSPRLSAGAFIKVGSEFMQVTATDTAANAITVIRGVHGSTAAAHALDDAIYVFQVEDDIRRVVARQAAFMYARAGAFESTTVTDMGGTVNFPSDLLAELRATVGGYAYE
jgi:hypothetical protein